MQGRGRLVRHAWLVLALVALLAAAVPSAQAQNGNAYDDQRVDFGSVDGRVEAIRAVGHLLWVGGQFTTATDADLVTTHPRQNLAVFDFTTGDVFPLDLAPNDKVKAITSDDAARIFIAGNFTEIAGQAVTYLVAVNAFDGSLDPNFQLTLDNELNSLHYRDGWLYIGGDFTQVNGQSYRSLARIDAATGALDPSFVANPNGKVRSIDSHGDRVYAAGNFDEVGFAPNEVEARWIATLDIDTGLPTGPDLSFPPLADGEPAHKLGLRHVRVSDDGSAVYTGDNRNQLTRFDSQTGQIIWQRETEGDIQGLVVDGDTIYAGNHDGFLAKGDERVLFAVDAVDGDPNNDFAPIVNSFGGTWGLAKSQGALIAGGDFTTVNGESSPHLAVFHSPGWMGATPLPAPMGDATCNGLSDITDALAIAQYTVGLRGLEGQCPLVDPLNSVSPAGDVNDNAVIDISDALLIAQCTAGIVNVACPD